MPQPLPCPVCAALVQNHEAHIEQHVTWHDATKTLGSKHGSYGTAQGLRNGFVEMRRMTELVVADDDAPTTRLPPITDTVRRRPPVPTVRALNDRAELIRAMSEELARELQELEDDATGDQQ